MADMAVEQAGLFKWLFVTMLDLEVSGSVYTTQGYLQVRAARRRRSRWQLLRPQSTSHRSKGEQQGSLDHQMKSSLGQPVNELEFREIVEVNDRSVLI